MKYLEHFRGEHQLKLIEKVDKANLAVCKACKEHCRDPYYFSCSVCDLNLHDLCAKLPSWFSNPFHPHTLSIFQTHMIGEPEQFQCHACFRNIDGFTYGYKCNECLIYLDVECALLRPVIKEDEDHVLIHFSHLHPLVLVATELKDVNDDPPRCYLCWEFIISSVLFYKCEPCRFYLHKSCAELKLPKRLDHFYHRCSLALCTERNPYICNACLRNRGGFHYLCDNCNFRLDVDCALLPEKMKSEGQDQLYHHPMHGHPLTLVDVTDDEAIHCVACQKSCCDKAHVCRWAGVCKFFLHQQCFLLPEKVFQPQYPGLQLKLTPECFPKARCISCYNLCNGLFYRTPSKLPKKVRKKLGGLPLPFNVHVKCPVEVSTITYQAHPHNLTFIENVIGNDVDNSNEFKGIKCKACGKDCISSSPLFRCARCNYNLHAECGPLPCIIPFKSELHTHPLRLIYSPVDGEDKNDVDVFYCDECENERDPRLPVYCCSEGCPYIAEIKCVISEVKRSLLGYNGEVELKSLITKMAGKVIGKYYLPPQETGRGSGTKNEDCNEIISRFRIEDTDLYRSISMAARHWAQNDTTKSMGSQASLFPNEALTLMNLLYGGKDIFKEDRPIFKVEDHFLKSDFAYIREALGDVILAKPTLQNSPVVDYFRFMLCWTINSMRTTRVVDISQELLSKWWKILKMVHFAGFNIQFALDRLDRIVFAYYGLQAKAEKENLQKIDGEISELDQDVKKLEALLVDKRARLQELQKRRGHVASKEIVGSSFIDKCLGEASELKWRLAGEGLFEK